MSADSASMLPLGRRLLWLIGLRVAIVTILLGAGVLAQVQARTTWVSDPFFFLLGITYALTVVYALTLHRAARQRWLIDLQFGLDTCLISALVLMTGGVTSFFSSLYALPILAASAVQDRQAGILVGFLSSVLYVGVVLTQYADPLALADMSVIGIELPPISVALYTTGLGVFGFIAVAGLSGHLAERLRRADASLEQASTQLADLQAFNQHVIESLTSGLATTDPLGRILTFNPTAERITGWSAPEAVGRDISALLQLPDDVGTGWTEAPSRRCEVEILYTHPSGSKREIAVTCAPLLTPSGQGGRLVVFDDVTERRHLERVSRLQQRLAAVGEMAAGIAHEIRNPLASMSGSIQILRHDLPLNAEQKRLMDIVLRESERLNDTIHAFLAYARPGRCEPQRLDLARVVSETALLLRHDSAFGEQHHLDVVVPSEPVWVEADENQMRQIIWNLATNALHAMPDGGCLALSVSGASEGGVVLRVSDDGVGIPSAEVDKVFQPFRGTFGKGTGLGLAIVHRVVSDHGGDVCVESTEGVGTTVEVQLPAQPHSVAPREYEETTH